MRSFLDDISQRAYGSNEQQVVENLVEAGKDLAQDLVASGCIVSKKSVVLARTKSTRNKIVKQLGHMGIQVTGVTRAKDLGVGTAIGHRRVIHDVRKRMIKAKGRG